MWDRETTWMISLAMQELSFADPHYRPKLLSMEHNEQWHAEAVKNFPAERFPFVEIKYSPKDVFGYELMRLSSDPVKFASTSYLALVLLTLCLKTMFS